MILQTLEEKIKQRRSQMLVHSYIYYELGSNVVSDHDWQQWADELTELQNMGEYPRIGFYDEAFKDWDGSTGYHLPRDNWVFNKAMQLIRSRDKRTGEQNEHCNRTIC